MSQTPHLPGVEDHGQSDSGDPFAGGHARCARDAGAFGLQLHGERFRDAAQEHVEDAELVPVALLGGVDDVADVRRRQSLHTDDAGQAHGRHLRKDASEQRRYLGGGESRGRVTRIAVDFIIMLFSKKVSRRKRKRKQEKEKEEEEDAVEEKKKQGEREEEGEKVEEAEEKEEE